MPAPATSSSSFIPPRPARAQRSPHRRPAFMKKVIDPHQWLAKAKRLSKRRGQVSLRPLVSRARPR
jgi:hypothetical protein